MLLKYISQQSKILFKCQNLFAQPTKKRTQAPKYTRTKQHEKVDPKKIDYSVVPQQLRKGVKAHVEASNMLVTSQAQLQAISLKQVILQQRSKLESTLNQIGGTQKQAIKQNTTNSSDKKSQQIQQQKNYDFTSALKFMSNVGNSLMVFNLAGYVFFNTLKKYKLLGFFLGVSMNPSIIALTALTIGFNSAGWIIRQSLHLQINNPNELTTDKVSLTGCSFSMYAQALAIAGQMLGLSYYLMSPNASSNISILVASFVLSQSHLILNIVRATGGYKFQHFSKLIIIQLMATFFIGSLTYSLFNQIQQCKNQQNQSQNQFSENFQIKKGYQRFLQQLRTQNYSMVAGEKINQLTLSLQ